MANLLVLSSNVCTHGVILTLHAGSRTVWCSLFTVVAFAMSPNAPRNTAVEELPVLMIGSLGLIVLDVAPVSLMAKEIVPLSSPLFQGGGALHYTLHLAMFLSTWPCGGVT